VIVGNGVAGMEAALALRARDEEARSSIVSAAHDHLFSRPALMYVFAGQTSLRDTEPYDRGLYERMRFDRVRGHVVSVDIAGRTLRFEDGPDLAWDKLLLAVGSKGRPAPWPGSDGPGLHYFVTLRDLEGLDRKAKPGMRAVVVGGGLIGVEVAEILHDRGLEVVFVIRETWYFPLALEHREASLVAEHMRTRGVDVRLGVNVDAIRRAADDSLRGVIISPAPHAERTEEGEIDADFVVSAIGVVPNTIFLRDSGITLGRGGAIETDDALRTSVPDVWAAGDCATVTWADGSRRPEQLWYTARDQGRAVARSMLGDEVVYRRGTWYNSAKFFDLEYTTAGWVPITLNFDNTPIDIPAGVRTWFYRVPGRFESQRIIVQGDRVVGFNMLGSRWNHEVLLEWIQEFSPRFRIVEEAVEVA
jgi:NADPH-dependent 2,4-dienoyl-CoA reductase/sulfur reductase-like enzyme